MKKIASAVMLSCFATTASAADDWLLVRPGMAVAEHESAWKEKCPSYVLTDNQGKENYLTCVMANGDAVTANIAPDGRAWWSRFWGAGHLDRNAFLGHFASELGLSGAPSTCSTYDEPSECWKAGTLLVTAPIGRDAKAWAIMLEDRTVFDPK